MLWDNYFVTSLLAKASEGHLSADSLREKILSHDGGEAYHGAFDLEPRPDFSNYSGCVRPSLGYVWFDFDSHDGGVAALADTRAFISWLGIQPDDLVVCYSGSKGFHVGVPFSATGIPPSNDLHSKLHGLATQLKAQFKTLDTTIYNANRKFRALGSRHPKTGLYKIALRSGSILSLTLEEIKLIAKTRGSLEIPEPKNIPISDHLRGLLNSSGRADHGKSERKSYPSVEGTEAFRQCGFLSHCKENQEQIQEPQWYAALSVVARFKEGRKQCHGISYKHKDYSAHGCNEKIDQALEEAGPRTCENISKLWDGCARCPLFNKISSPINIRETSFWYVGQKGNLLPMYNELLEEFKTITPYRTIADMKTVYTFKETHYVECTPIEIKAFAEDKFEPKPKERERQEFVHKVFSNHVARRSFFTESTENKLNFANGVLGLTDEGGRSAALVLHHESFGFRHVLPYRYDPSAEAPTFLSWIKDVMLGDEALVKILQEYMGYVIRGGEYKYHKALWLSGSGRNGKSTFLSVLKALIGTGNYSTLSIRQIIGDKFSSADLDGKIANFSEETSPEELSDSGPFKNLTGDGELLAQKKYGDPYSFRNRAKLIMTYNEVPILKDLSPGMLSRPIIIPFKKDLTDESLQDRNLKKKLLAELPGIFNFALRGWERLEEQEGFTTSPKCELAKLDVQTASCSALRWIEERVEFVGIEDVKPLTPKSLYDAYCQWKGDYALSDINFFRRIGTNAKVAARKDRKAKGFEYLGMKLDKIHEEF